MDGIDEDGSPSIMRVKNNLGMVDLGTRLAGEDLANDVMNVASKSGVLLYRATAGTDIVVSAGRTFLAGIVFGADNGSAQVEVSDHVSDGDGNVKIQLNGNTLLTSIGYLPVNAWFEDGITCDVVNQTQMTFIGF